MIVTVLVATDGDNNVQVCEVYEDPNTSPQYGAIGKAWNRFFELREIYGSANVYLASREVIELPVALRR